MNFIAILMFNVQCVEHCPFSEIQKQNYGIQITVHIFSTCHVLSISAYTSDDNYQLWIVCKTTWSSWFSIFFTFLMLQFSKKKNVFLLFSLLDSQKTCFLFVLIAIALILASLVVGKTLFYCIGARKHRVNLSLKRMTEFILCMYKKPISITIPYLHATQVPERMYSDFKCRSSALA